jgi:hypothetical protein
MNLHLKIIGWLLVILALLHFTFPKYFKWKQELSGLSLINRQLMYIHALFIALIIFLIGLLCITSANELVNTNLGREVSLGLGIFWAARLWVQFFGYSSKVWRGKRFETAIHVVFSIFWTYLSSVFIMVYLA